MPRLARCGEAEVLSSVVFQYERVEEPAFRAGGTPFYWLAARLWLVIALDRISDEVPEGAAPYGTTLLSIALNDEFPHLLIRGYAADACRKLIASNQLEPSPAQTAALERVNKGLPSENTSPPLHHGHFNSFRSPEGSRRFHFDALDTLRYWYEGWLSVFEDIGPEAFLQAAEGWIVDKWEIQDDLPYGSKEPRPQRFLDRDHGLADTSHGSQPTLEHHRNHLEWHAMWCVAGQLLKTHRLNVPRYDDDDELTYRISRNKLTHSPHWLSDFIGPFPLEEHRWLTTDQATEDWLGGIKDKELLPSLPT